MTAPLNDCDRALTATSEDLAALLHHHSPDVLLALLNNPALDEPQLCLLLGRKDLPTELLAEIAGRKAMLKSYRVKRGLAFHPRTPRRVAFRMARELYLMDLAQLALQPGSSAQLKRIAENQLTARLPQLPLGQKITLARRGPARVAGALENANLTEAQVLKALSRDDLALEVTEAVVRHRKWSCCYNVRVALVRHPKTTLSTVLGYLPELTVTDLRDLAEPGILPETMRKYLLAEIHRRTVSPGR